MTTTINIYKVTNITHRKYAKLAISKGFATRESQFYTQSNRLHISPKNLYFYLKNLHKA
jgi:hypothetical protein